MDGAPAPTSQWRDTVLEIIKTKKDGVPHGDLEAALSKIDGVPADAVTAISSECINELLKDGFVELLTLDDGTPYYRELDQEEAAKLRGLSPDETAAYRRIAESGNQGVWIAELKKFMHIKQPQKMEKIMKKLLGRGLVKTVKGIAGKKQKVMYMLSELEPSDELTGGLWYNASGEVKTDFIEELKMSAYEFISSKPKVDVAAILQHLRLSGLSQVELQAEHAQSIVDVLALDGKIEKSKMSHVSGMKVEYRAQRLQAMSNALTDIPCGICTIQDMCSTKGGIVSPQECQYLKEWLEPLTD